MLKTVSFRNRSELRTICGPVADVAASGREEERRRERKGRERRRERRREGGEEGRREGGREGRGERKVAIEKR